MSKDVSIQGQPPHRPLAARQRDPSVRPVPRPTAVLTGFTASASSPSSQNASLSVPRGDRYGRGGSEGGPVRQSPLLENEGRDE